MEKKRILIAEDDKFLANAYRIKFEKTDLDVVIAEDGVQLLSEMEKKIPNVVLLDLIMPRMDGFTALEELRKNPKFKGVPVIITSNLSQKEDIDRGMSLGANDYFVKSDISLEQIVEKIKKYLK